MAFKMNKPVIHGTKKHSALRKEAEATRTHSGDPSILAAAKAYGESFENPDVIDWTLKSRAPEIEKIEKKKKEKDNGEETTINDRNTATAKEDADAAKKRLADGRELSLIHI